MKPLGSPTSLDTSSISNLLLQLAVRSPALVTGNGAVPDYGVLTERGNRKLIQTHTPCGTIQGTAGDVEFREAKCHREKPLPRFFPLSHHERANSLALPFPRPRVDPRRCNRG